LQREQETSSCTRIADPGFVVNPNPDPGFKRPKIRKFNNCNINIFCKKNTEKYYFPSLFLGGGGGEGSFRLPGSVPFAGSEATDPCDPDPIRIQNTALFNERPVDSNMF
jgi:hypothetical protein